MNSSGKICVNLLIQTLELLQPEFNETESMEHPLNWDVVEAENISDYWL